MEFISIPPFSGISIDRKHVEAYRKSTISILLAISNLIPKVIDGSNQVTSPEMLHHQ